MSFIPRFKKDVIVLITYAHAYVKNNFILTETTKRKRYYIGPYLNGEWVGDQKIIFLSKRHKFDELFWKNQILNVFVVVFHEQK